MTVVDIICRPEEVITLSGSDIQDFVAALSNAGHILDDRAVEILDRMSVAEAVQGIKGRVVSDADLFLLGRAWRIVPRKGQ